MGEVDFIQKHVHTCFKCKEEIKYSLGANAYHVICPKCALIYEAYEGPLNKTLHSLKPITGKIHLPVGSTGKIQGRNYLITGYSYKREKGTNYYWHEYTLFNPLHGFKYLSMYNGHWTFLSEINDYHAISDRTALYNGETYQLYSKYRAQLIGASGEFAYCIDPDEIILCEEYICPPHILINEKSNTNLTKYHGVYIEPEELKDAFNVKILPEKIDVGAIQPFVGKFQTKFFQNLVITLVVIWGALQLLFIATSENERVFIQNYSINDSLSKKEIYTGPFEIAGGQKNVEIKISASIDNNWLYSAVTLVNEVSGDLYALDLEAEYYHGYEGGESWSEGSPWVSKVISQVPSGKYYMILYFDKPPNLSSVSVEVEAKRDVYILSNGILVFIILGIFPTYYFYKIKNFEVKRWSNSNYSPYDDPE